MLGLNGIGVVGGRIAGVRGDKDAIFIIAFDSNEAKTKRSTARLLRIMNYIYILVKCIHTVSGGFFSNCISYIIST